MNNSEAMIVCPTSHLDWDWCSTFSQYEQLGPQDGQPYDTATDIVLNGVADLLKSTPSFCFSLAEVGFLRAFVERYPEQLEALVAADSEHFLLMGGGIT